MPGDSLTDDLPPDAAPSDATSSDAIPSDAEADIAFCRAVSRELADMGMSIARALHERIVQTDDAPPPAPDHHLPGLTRAFHDASTSVRRTLLLIERLARPPRRVLSSPILSRPAPPPNPDKLAACKQVIRAVENQIARTDVEAVGAERLTGELHERLETPDFEHELDTRPVGHIIDDIVRDLGLAPVGQWKRRTPADVAAIATRAADAALARARAGAGAAVPPASLPGLATPAAAPERNFRLLATPKP